MSRSMATLGLFAAPSSNRSRGTPRSMRPGPSGPQHLARDRPLLTPGRGRPRPCRARPRWPRADPDARSCSSKRENFKSPLHTGLTVSGASPAVTTPAPRAAPPRGCGHRCAAPRSPTSTTRHGEKPCAASSAARPKVPGPAVLPSRTSTATGQPLGLSESGPAQVRVAEQREDDPGLGGDALLTLPSWRKDSSSRTGAERDDNC